MRNGSRSLKNYMILAFRPSLSTTEAGKNAPVSLTGWRSSGYITRTPTASIRRKRSDETIKISIDTDEKYDSTIYIADIQLKEA